MSSRLFFTKIFSSNCLKRFLVLSFVFSLFAYPRVLAQDEEIVELEELAVVGSRSPFRTVADSPVPVDVIEAEIFINLPDTDMDLLLTAIISSYNVNQQPISGAATLMRPANLRGLPPDDTLVLINGKRRHRGSVITFFWRRHFGWGTGT